MFILPNQLESDKTKLSKRHDIITHPQTKFGSRQHFHKYLSFCPRGRGVCIQGGSASGEGSASRGGLPPRGVCLQGGLQTGVGGILRDTVNKRALRILLECILVSIVLASNSFRVYGLLLLSKVFLCNFGE